VNEKAGSVISSRNPSLWTMTYNPAGLLNSQNPIHILTGPDGSTMNSTREKAIGWNVVDYVDQLG